MIGRSSDLRQIVLFLLGILFLWYLFMDGLLYLRIQNYPIDRSFYTTNSHQPEDPLNYKVTSTPPFTSTSLTINARNQSAFPNYEDVVWISCTYNPLCHVTIKSIMLDHTNHYVFAALATFVDRLLALSDSTWISPNLISFSHVFVAILAAKCVASDCLWTRRLGVVLFQVRTFLDDVDGHVARQRKHIRGERSEIGSAGFYVDGICDGLGCIALLLGILVHLRNNPPRRGYTPMQSQLLPVVDGKSECLVYKTNMTSNKVTRKVACFGFQLLLSSIGWNRYISVYQDTLERNDVQHKQFLRQMIVFRSHLLFCIVWLWRIVNVHSLLHFLLLAVFCDRIWAFLRWVQYLGFVVLMSIICVSEMHVLDVHRFVSNNSWWMETNESTSQDK